MAFGDDNFAVGGTDQIYIDLIFDTKIEWGSKWSPILGVGSNIGPCILIGWPEHSDIDFYWVSFSYPTYVSAIHMPSTKPDKLAEDKIIPAIIDYVS